MTSSELTEIAFSLEDNNINITDIDFEEIIETVSESYKFYQGQESHLFEKLYCNLITMAIKSNNKDNIACVLLTIAQNISAIESLLHNREEENKLIDYWWNISSKRLIELELLKNRNRIKDWNLRHQRLRTGPQFVGRGLVYTVITGDYDDVKNPSFVDEEFDYFLFTNNEKIKSDFWNVVYLTNTDRLSDVLLARKVKILGHEIIDNYDYSIYMDGQILIKGSMRDYIDSFAMDESMLCFPHPGWNTVNEEIARIKELKKADGKLIDMQYKDYLVDGFKDDYGLIESGVLVRKCNDRNIKRVMKMWWDEVFNRTPRDQVSFPYVCWKCDFVYDMCSVSLEECTYFELDSHKDI